MSRVNLAPWRAVQLRERIRSHAMRATVGLFAFVASLFGHHHEPARADAPIDASVVMAQVQAFYDKTPDLTAEFKQHITSDLYGPQPAGHGIVYLKKGGKMLWDYDQPQRQEFISDGRMLWVYQPDDRQVIKQNLAESALPTAVTFLTGTGKLSADFTGKAVKRADGTIELVLTPKRASGILDHLTLELDPATYQVKESIVSQTDGQTNDIRFEGVKTGTGLKDDRFSFTPPAGVTVVDPSKLGGAGRGSPGNP